MTEAAAPAKAKLSSKVRAAVRSRAWWLATGGEAYKRYCDELERALQEGRVRVEDIGTWAP